MEARDRPAEEIKVTPEMVRAARGVGWFDDYRNEFGVDDDREIARELAELIVALLGAGFRT